ncbi:cytochrome P450 [Sediminicoccus sp. KRV36]|uniref:cytochrome P450 n=1 Tax=Sediminicoccus sp. KRV36 TaxID=3133721 RepID=UPI00200E968D|nr:cytochrome P450 [Sediminicoccus rosea]UPY37367.1 cytochrome P450 [Sediminicoccus rosea]
MTTTEDFIPPRPAAPPRFPRGLRALRASATDLLSLFPETAFRHRMMPFSAISQRVLIVNEPEMVRRVFITGRAEFEAKSRHFRQALEPVIGDSMFLNSGEIWLTRRALMAKLLHPSRTAGFHPVFVRGAEELAAAWNGRVDVAAGFAAATALAVMRALFGEAAKPEDAARLARSFTAYEGAVLAVDFAHVFGLPERLTGWQWRTARKHARDIRAICAASIAAAGPNPGGLFGGLRAALGEHGQALLDPTQLINEVAMLLLAGSETSANVLTWALYLIARHAPTRERLRAEHAAVLGGRAPEVADLNALPFTKAVIQEAMRLYPPVPYLSREAARAERIAGIQVQAGETVMAMPWLLHRNSHLWEAPHAFRPQRFLPEAPQKPPQFGYLPFSIGPRVCAGASFAMAEMMVFLAVLLPRLDFTLAQDTAPVPRARLTLRPKGGMPLTVARRQPSPA